jgi:parallel beta-helix repeat protein
VLALSVVLSGIQVSFAPDKKAVVLTIGSVEASADYAFTGVADDVPFQAALNALPSTGGEIHVLAPATGFTAINFTATVTRAIANVTISGVGQGTPFAYNAGTAIFTMGGNNWVFKDIKTDAGGINTNSKTGWIYENVTINTTTYVYRTSTDITADKVYIPTGRTVNTFIAATDATAKEKAQSDVLVVGTADDEIQAAITAGGHVVLSSGTFTIHTAMTSTANLWLQGQGENTIVKLEDAHNANIAILTITHNYVTVSDIQFDGNSAAQASGDDSALIISGTHGTVKNCIVHHWNKYCINAGAGSTYFTADNNYVYTSYAGIFAYDDYSNLTNNTVDGMTAAAGGMELYQCSNSSMINNTVMNSYMGISINQAGGGNFQGLIQGNKIYACNDAGINIDTGIYMKVIGNSVYNTTTVGIRVELGTGVIVADNTVVSSGRHGIYVYDNSGVNNIVDANVLVGNGQETDNTFANIMIEAGTATTVSNNTCRQGTGMANQSKYGIDVSGANAVKTYVHGNDLYDSGQTADYHDSGTGTLKRDNRNLAGTGLLADS